MKNKECQILRESLSNADEHLLAMIGPIFEASAATIANGFYHHMMHHPESKLFLDHETVEKRLKHSMKLWISALFKANKSQTDIENFIKHQLDIGTGHARINIPLTAINIGTSVLKKEFFRKIIESGIPREKLADAIILVDEIMDHSMGVINHVYLGDMVQDARDNQSLKMNSIGMDMALQTETLRSALFDWHRQILRVLIDPQVNPDKIPSIKKTDFGLWVFHKGNLMFPGLEEIVKLKKTVEVIHDAVNTALAKRDQGWSNAIEGLLQQIDENVTEATAILGVLTERNLAMETGRDPLTKLFNRRFLRGIMQSEVHASIQTGERFAVIIADIDHFKSINDRFGHDAGDLVLRQFAEILISAVRAGDYVFRYGGEEFLMVINNVNSIHGENVAGKIHSLIGNYEFHISKSKTIHITASLGVSIHDGHPDYSRVLTKADEALYKAKNSGRNRYVILEPNDPMGPEEDQWEQKS